MEEIETDNVHTLDLQQLIFEKTFTVASLVIVGTREPSGDYDLAPKHLSMPLSWEGHYGFVCTPRHGTYQNVIREQTFTVSYPRPEQLVSTSMTAVPRTEESTKPELEFVETIPAPNVDGKFVKGSYIYLECELESAVDELGDNSLVIGRIVGQHAHKDVLRSKDRDDRELIQNHPLFAYLHPGRFASVEESRAFPLPEGFRR